MNVSEMAGINDIDPFTVLCVSEQAGDEEIRQAYLQKIRECPPERDEAQFERIRDAYEMIKDANRRARRRLIAVNPNAPLASLLKTTSRYEKRKFVGPEPWLGLIKSK
jgi:curved DNA-binding protein CbpA